MPETPHRKAYKKDWYEKNKKRDLALRKQMYHESPDIQIRQRINALKLKFKMTIDDYENMVKEQKGLCAICHKPESKIVNGKIILLAIDHNHKTGKVRGLLCYSCNIGIGHLRDNPELLRLAAKYLEEYKA